MFHPLIETWFHQRFGEPTDPQRRGWPEIVADRNVLIAAPTGSGKTLAAFLACIDRLYCEGLAGTLSDSTRVVYVSPLKALSNDIHRNLEVPLAELRQVALEAGLEPPHIRAEVRTGDTPARDRAAMLRRPPHILVTTPESLYLLVTSTKGREMLRGVETVIVDEIHALARDKRGSHLSITLERLEHLCEKPPVRIGLSATQAPIDKIARFLVGSVRSAECGVGNEKPEVESLAPVPRPGTSESIENPTPPNPPWAAGLNGEQSLTPSPPHPFTRSLPPRTCSIIDGGHQRELDLGVEVPPSELEAVCSGEQWGEVYERLSQLIRAHHSTLVFVNTRKLAERVAHQLRQSLGEEAVAAHHGSLSREIRFDAEERLKRGELKAIVATASLEMGIDVGYIELVCQIGSPRSIATFLQRVGRSGHSLGVIPKGRLFPLTRDELLECIALVRAVKAGRLDKIEVPVAPLDLLAQQIVAMCAAEEWLEDDLYSLVTRAWPYRNLSRQQFDRIVTMLSEGVSLRSKAGSWLHRDGVNQRVKARRGARIVAVTCGGAIPELGDYRVVTEGEGTFVGSVNEDFALESNIGDVFLLGNTSWRVRYVRGSEVAVSDAQGAPATVPFWLGEAPGRTIELSQELSTLREELETRVQSLAPVPRPEAPESIDNPTPHNPPWAAGLNEDTYSTLTPSPLHPFTPSSLHSKVNANGGGREPDISAAVSWLQSECNLSDHAATQAARYVAAQIAAVGLVPTLKRIVFERFFDESGGMQLVVHAPLGARIMRAWGLAFRKRFCRSFDFELQASADEDGLVLSLGPQHSFPIDSMFGMLTPDNGRYLLEQALLAAPVFQTRWRWAVTRSLAVLRNKHGKRVPPNLQRYRSDDLLAAVFPAQAGCLENHHGDTEIPDHPLIDQTMRDCLHEAMDVDRWLEVLADIRAGKIELVARDTREPSPFSHEIVNANPYAFLDGAPLEERRTRAVTLRRGLSFEAASDLGRLDPEAIAQVRAEAWPLVRDADEMHDALQGMCLLRADEAPEWKPQFDELVAKGRATTVRMQESEVGSQESNAENPSLAPVPRPDEPESIKNPSPPNPPWAAGLNEDESPTLSPSPLLPFSPSEQPIQLSIHLNEDRSPVPPPHFWTVAERWPLIKSLYPNAIAEPLLTLPDTIRHDWESAEAIVTLVRGRMQTTGPITAIELAEKLSLDADRVFAALEAVEAEGSVMRGNFTRPAENPSLAPVPRPAALESTDNSQPNASTCLARHPSAQASRQLATEWCERRLLARIHRKTLDGLRRQIQPAEPRDFIRFLLRWHHLSPGTHWHGRAGLRKALAQLQGFESAAGLWERRILPARCDKYDSVWLDELSMSGELAWGRLCPPKKDADDGPSSAVITRAAPISLLFRENLGWLLPRDRASAEANCRTGAAAVLDALNQRGALFQHELMALTGLLPAQLDEALHELAALGLVTADAFTAVRTITGSSTDRRRMEKRRRLRRIRREFTVAPSGRWSRFPGIVAPVDDAAAVTHWAWQLLRRWGVMFRDLLEREPAAPSWGRLVHVYRRLEARGEIRGGRFVRGVGGEQYALPEAVELLRSVRDEPPDDQTIVLAAADPANLSGIITDELRIPITHTNTVAIRNGQLAAACLAGQTQWFIEPSPDEADNLNRRLRLQHHVNEEDRPAKDQTPVISRR